ncbi:MAG TPA: hypothetical protein VNS34_12185 [Rhizobiaceae bacterium]|nr:hypothetical protein [Rhizobiaceae bacterium]
MTKRFATLEGLKRAAVKLKRDTGISHNAALEQVARDAGFADYHNAVQTYAVSGGGDDAAQDSESALGPLEIIEIAPELAAMLKHQRDLDIAAAGPQAEEGSEFYRGVTIESRWSIMHELATMRRMVNAMPDLVRMRITSIWCDSNCQAWYGVEVMPQSWYDGIGEDVRDAVLDATDGFNGLRVSGGRHEAYFEPEWQGDDYDYAADGEP